MSVTHLRPATAVDVVLTKKQLAAHLERSVRWVELRTREGMPSHPPTKRYPTRRYNLAEVERWLEEGPPAKTGAVNERVAELEATVARLAATVERLERRSG